MTAATMPTRAVVIGASGGIGAALAEALADEDIAVAGFARSFEGDRHIDIENEDSIAAAASRPKPTAAAMRRVSNETRKA